MIYVHVLLQLIEAKEESSVLWRLVQGPLFKAQSYRKYQVNGFVFCSLDYEEKLVTQNSGVSLRAMTGDVEVTYYGIIRQIIELNFMDFEETVFFCDWVKEDKSNGFKVDPQSHVIKVNLSKLRSNKSVLDEPFILASEATQVFYAQDVTDAGWSIVLHSQQRLTSAVDDIEVPISYQSVFTDNESLEKLICVDSIV